MNRKMKILLFIFSSILLSVGIFSFAFAAEEFPNLPSLSEPVNAADNSVLSNAFLVQVPIGLPTTDLRVVIARLIRIAMSFIGIILVVLVIYAGFLWMTAGGNDEQIDKAKKTLFNAIIGLIIILLSNSIVNFVINIFVTP